jgi:hypothetical protein
MFVFQLNSALGSNRGTLAQAGLLYPISTMFGLFSSSNSSKGIEDDLMNLKLSAKQLKRESAKSEKEMAKAKEQVRKVSKFNKRSHILPHLQEKE